MSLPTPQAVRRPNKPQAQVWLNVICCQVFLFSDFSVHFSIPPFPGWHSFSWRRAKGKEQRARGSVVVLTGNTAYTRSPLEAGQLCYPSFHALSLASLQFSVH